MRTCPIRGDEDIVGQLGRVKISLEFGEDSRGRRNLVDLNSLPDKEEFLDDIDDIPMWRIEIREDKDELPS